MFALVGLCCWSATVTPVSASAPGHNQELVFLNARIALREQREADVLKLWLLRNVLLQRGEHSAYDREFRSVVWAALGVLGYCQDGLGHDDDGAGLWPLALHNYLLQAMGRDVQEQAPPWDAFQAPRQQRFVSLKDVLSAEELRSVTFHRSGCLQPLLALTAGGEPRWLDVKDRLSVGLLMYELLARSRASMVRHKVRNIALVEARMFDLNVALVEMQLDRSRREATLLTQLARSVGVSEAAARDLGSSIARLPSGTSQSELLQEALTWPAQAWLDLARDRRLALFGQVQQIPHDQQREHALILSVIDELGAAKQGAELASWIGLLAAPDLALTRSVIDGDRGQMLLGLDSTTGFRERAVIALHRGVVFLERGARDEALRSFAFALAHAEESRAEDTTRALARRWLSYVVSQYDSSASVIDTLKAMVPRRELNQIVEDLVWRATLRADSSSFERLAASVVRGGSLDARIVRLRPLSRGRLGEWATLLRAEAKEEPYAVLAVLLALVGQIEKESLEVRREHIATLKLMVEVVQPLISADPAATSLTRRADALIDRVQAILDGLGQLLQDEREREMSPRHDAYAGSVRLAPADSLPWPFTAAVVRAPSAFLPLKLLPIEWRDDEGALVFGWRVTE